MNASLKVTTESERDTLISILVSNDYAVWTENYTCPPGVLVNDGYVCYKPKYKINKVEKEVVDPIQDDTCVKLRKIREYITELKDGWKDGVDYTDQIADSIISILGDDEILQEVPMSEDTKGTFGAIKYWVEFLRERLNHYPDHSVCNALDNMEKLLQEEITKVVESTEDGITEVSISELYNRNQEALNYAEGILGNSKLYSKHTINIVENVKSYLEGK